MNKAQTTSKTPLVNRKTACLVATRNSKFLKGFLNRQHTKALEDSISPSYVLGYN